MKEVSRVLYFLFYFIFMFFSLFLFLWFDISLGGI